MKSDTETDIQSDTETDRAVLMSHHYHDVT